MKKLDKKTLEGITVSIEQIGPDEASEMLAKNIGCQRHVRQSHVKYLTREMKECRWKLNGDTIVISSTGKLINGQHRLLSIIASGTTQYFLIVRGIADNAFDTFDRNAPRTFADLNQIEGKTIATYRASVCMNLWKHAKATSRGGSINMYDRPDYQDLDEIDSKNCSLIEESKSFASPARKTLGLPPAITGACYVLIGSKAGNPTAIEFFTRFINGDMLEVGNPILILRNSLVADQSSTAKLPPYVKMAMVIKGFNLWKSGKRGVRLKIQYRFGDKDDKFPVVE